MAAGHGTRRRYTDGCRCAACRDVNASYQQRYRERRITGEAPIPHNSSDSPGVPFGTPGPVELAVAEEIDGLASEARPGLAQAALTVARILDNPRAINQQPAATKVLVSLLEKLRSASARGRRGNLALVRTMTEETR